MTPRDRRALGLGAAVILGAVIALRVLPPVWQRVTAAEARLAALRMSVERGRADLSAFKALEDSTTQLVETVRSLAPWLVAGRSSSEAAAALAGHLSHVAVTQRTRLERSDLVADSARAGDLRRVTLDATLEGDIRGLTGTLGALASLAPVTEVTRLWVTAPDPGQATAGPELLRIELRIRGWYLGPEAS